MGNKVSYEKLETSLTEIFETQEVVRSIYQCLNYDYTYEVSKKERYQEMLNGVDEIERETARQQLPKCIIRIKAYQKVFDYCDSLLRGKV